MRYYKLYYDPIRDKMKKVNSGVYVSAGGSGHNTYCALEAKKFFMKDPVLRQKFYEKLSRGVAPFTSPHYKCYEDMELNHFYISDASQGMYDIYYKFRANGGYKLYEHYLESKEHKNDYMRVLAEFYRTKRPPQELFELQNILGNI